MNNKENNMKKLTELMQKYNISEESVKMIINKEKHYKTILNEQQRNKIRRLVNKITNNVKLGD